MTTLPSGITISRGQPTSPVVCARAAAASIPAAATRAALCRTFLMTAPSGNPSMLTRGRRPFQFDPPAAAKDDQSNRRAGGKGAQRFAHTELRAGIGEADPVNLEDDIASHEELLGPDRGLAIPRLQSDLRRGRAGGEPLDEDAPLLRELEDAGEVPFQQIALHPRPDRLSREDECLGHVRGRDEPEAARAGLAEDDVADDPDDVAVHVEHRTAAVPGVDR